MAGQPVLRAWLFGSYAAGTATESSDVDILVELDHSVPVGLRFIQMWRELQELLGIKTDLVTVNGLSPHIRHFVDAQKKLVYERKNRG